MDLVDLLEDEYGPSGDDGNDGSAQRLQEVELELAQASWCPPPPHSCRLRFALRHSPTACGLGYPCAWQVEHQVEVLLARQAALQAERERLTRAMAVERRAPRADWTGAFPWVRC